MVEDPEPLKGIAWAMKHPEDGKPSICAVAGMRVVHGVKSDLWRGTTYTTTESADIVARQITDKWIAEGKQLVAGPMEFILPSGEPHMDEMRVAAQEVLFPSVVIPGGGLATDPRYDGPVTVTTTNRRSWSDLIKRSPSWQELAYQRFLEDPLWSRRRDTVGRFR